MVVVLIDGLVHLEAGSDVSVAGERFVVHRLVGAGQLLAVLVHQVPDHVLGDQLLGSHVRRGSHAQLAKDLHPQLLLGEVQEEVPAGAGRAAVGVAVRKTSPGDQGFVLGLVRQLVVAAVIRVPFVQELVRQELVLRSSAMVAVVVWQLVQVGLGVVLALGVDQRGDGQDQDGEETESPQHVGIRTRKKSFVVSKVQSLGSCSGVSSGFYRFRISRGSRFE